MGILQEPSSLGASLSSCRVGALGPTPTSAEKIPKPQRQHLGKMVLGVVSYAGRGQLCQGRCPPAQP